MRRWLRRKLRDIRHAAQELRTGDAIDRTRSGVRTTTVDGRPPGDELAVPVPMGIERVLRKAAIDEGFRSRLVAGREATLDASGLAFTDSERAILLATPEEQLSAMVDRLQPAAPARRGFLRRVAAAAGLAIFGAVNWGCRDRARSSTAGADIKVLNTASQAYQGDSDPEAGWTTVDELESKREQSEADSRPGITPEEDGDAGD